MAQYYYHHPAPQSSSNPHPSFGPSSSHHNNNGNNNNHRSRRSARYSSTQNPHKQFNKNPRNQLAKDAAAIAHTTAYRKDFEAARSFELEDDEIFCPWHLLTEDDLHSIHSASSDRSSSLGSDSPDNSPLPHQIQPTPTLAMPVANQSSMSSSSYHPGTSSAGNLKIHQPLAQRARNPIPIVDPNSRHASPPTSISPSRQVQKSWYPTRRW